MIRVDDLFGSTDITNFGLFVGAIKVTVTISNNLFFAVWRLPPLLVAMRKDTDVINIPWPFHNLQLAHCFLIN